MTEAPEHGYLLVKGGLYYRPDACGYTGIKANAGRYSLAEAEYYHDPSAGVSVTHESIAPEFSCACYDDLKAQYLMQQRDDQDAEITRLRAELERVREAGQAVVKAWGDDGDQTLVRFFGALCDLRDALEEEDGK